MVGSMRTAALARDPAVEFDASAGQSDSTADRFRAIVDEHGEFLWRSLRRLGVCEADLADAAQQVFLVIARRIADIRPGSERSFAFQAALRVAANVRRTRRRRREIPDDVLLEHDDTAPGPESLADQRCRRAQLDAILECLALEVRAVFVLSEIEGLCMAEISVLLGIPAGTVASRLRRARKQFDAQVTRLHEREKANQS
jgi:RNA polymerase sigma-70 factor (ECF subfamily)